MNNREEMSEGMTPKLPLWSYQVQSDSKLAVRTRKDFEINLIAKCFEDEVFKQEFLANPKAVVEKELGTTLPEEIEINVLEETETILYMVLPSNPYEEFSEQELQASLGMTYEDVAQWVYEQQPNTLLEERQAISVISRSWKDGNFKYALLANPKEILEKHFNQEISEEIEIKFIDEATNQLYIVLPKLTDDLNYLAHFPLTADIAGFVDGGQGEPEPQTTIPCTIIITLVLCSFTCPPLY
jgi:hypothetical protein